MRTFHIITTFAILSLLVACSSNTPMQQNVADSSVEDPSKTTSETVVAQNNTHEKEQQICKVRAITGSRFKQKTCMTAKEWETMSHESKGMVDEATRNKIRYTD